MQAIRAMIGGVSLCVMAGCASSTLDGTVEGSEFGDVESAIFMVQSGSVHELQLVLTNYPEACTTYTPYFQQDVTPSEPGPLHAFRARFYLLEEVVPGDYAIVGENETYDDGITWVHAFYQTHDGQTWDGPAAESGEIVIDTLDAQTMTGTLTATLSTGDSLEGKFEAEICEVEDF